MPERSVKLGTLLRRGIRKRCPVCGNGGLFSTWFKLRDRCPSCGYPFAREEGYWVSAIIVNMAVIEAIFLVVFMVTVIATAPDIPWGPLVLIAAGVNVVFPIFWYPFSKTTWMAIDLYFHPLEARERGHERS